MSIAAPPTNDLQTPQKTGIRMDKIIGYSLLVVGLGMIGIPVYMVINVFTGKSKPPRVINVSAPSIALPSVGGSLELPEELKSQGFSIKQSDPSKSEQKIIPDEVFNLYINSGFFYLMMLFVTSAGAKIAGIGVHLTKDIKVKIKP